MTKTPATHGRSSATRLALLGLALFLVASAVDAAEVVRAARWDLHSSFWANLHQTLMWDASSKQPRDFNALTADERKIWDAAVASYRSSAGKGSITFSDVMMAAQDAIAQIADDAAVPQIDSPLAESLRSAAPIYRKHWWPAHDRANRFVIGYTAAMLRDAGEELASAHEKVYGHDIPKTIRVDVSGYAGVFGAYTHDLRYSGTVVTMSSLDASGQGVTALETILHETSHSIVSPRYGSVARAIANASQNLKIEIPRDLWHAILFATTSYLTRNALAARGNTSYVPSSEDLLTRAWPQYRKPIETHWYPYLAGEGSLSAAIEKVVAATRTP